jgi:hypothetical protein
MGLAAEAGFAVSRLTYVSEVIQVPIASWLHAGEVHIAMC